MNGHPRDQAKMSVHCRWSLIRGHLTLKCVGRGIDNVAVQCRWPLTTGVAQGRYYCIVITRDAMSRFTYCGKSGLLYEWSILLPFSVHCSLQGSFFSRIDDALLGGFRVSGGVHAQGPRQLGPTHSSADWWDFYFPWHRHHRRDQRLLLPHPKDTVAKRGTRNPKRNCQSSEEKSFYRSGTRTIDRPVAGRRPNPLGHRSPYSYFVKCLGVVFLFFINFFLYISSSFLYPSRIYFPSSLSSSSPSS